MRKKRDEVSYYPEIMDFLKNQIESNFRSSKKPLKVYCKTGELRKGLHEIIDENRLEIESIKRFADKTPPLSLDIFGIITDGDDYQLLIVEVKDLKSVGLQQLSQLVGYCIVSRSEYGILMNVDGGESRRLTDLINTDKDLLTINQKMSSDETIIHQLGVMQWDSMTKNITYSGTGNIGSISKLCASIAEKFV